MAEGRAILVIGPRWVGDMVMAQCLFKALKRRDAEVPIDVMAPAWATPLVDRMPEVRQRIDAPFHKGSLELANRMGVGRALRGQYSEAYVLPGSWKSALVPFAARIPHRVGYVRELRYGLLNDARRIPAGQKRKTAWLFQALVDPGPLVNPTLSVDRANQGRLLEQCGLTAGGYVAMMPGAEFGAAKRWPERHYAELARALGEQGLKSVLLGSVNDRPVGQAIVAAAPGVIDLTGETRLEDAIDLIGAARLAVSNDSGLMHVAAAVGTPIVALFGSTSAENTPPLSARAEVVSLNLACSPCQKRICPFGHLDCLNGIGADRVIAAARRLGAI